MIRSILDLGKILVLAAIGLTSVNQSRAQTPTTPLEFEVASVKPRPAAPGAMLVAFRHGTLNVDLARLRQIIGLAYGIQRVRVQGGPNWLDVDQYVIAAKAEKEDAHWDQVKTMLQALLVDRFKLKVHRETKDLDEYSLVLAKNGPKLQEANEDEKTDTTQSRSPRGAQMTFQKIHMGGLVNTLANILGSPVLDKTGLQGFYNFKLEWMPDGLAFQRTGIDQGAEAAPDLFRALQEQLGLTLEKKKAPGEVLVVDRAEKASEN